MHFLIFRRFNNQTIRLTSLVEGEADSGQPSLPDGSLKHISSITRRALTCHIDISYPNHIFSCSMSSPLILRHHSLCRTSSPSSPPKRDQYFFKNHTFASQLRTSHGVPVEAYPVETCRSLFPMPAPPQHTKPESISSKNSSSSISCWRVMRFLRSVRNGRMSIIGWCSIVICSWNGLRSGFRDLKVSCTVRIRFLLAASSTITAVGRKNGERDSSAHNASSVTPTCLTRSRIAAMVQTLSMRRLLVYGSAVVVFVPNLNTLTSLWPRRSGHSVCIRKCGLVQPQSMVVVQYNSRLSLGLSLTRREGSTHDGGSHTVRAEGDSSEYR